MYSGSSRGPRRVNPDGSINVYCQTCGEFISKTMIPIVKAQCAMCDAVENGHDLDEQAVREYMAGKTQQQGVTLLTLPVPDGRAVKRKFRISDLTGGFMEAIGIKRKKKAEPDSVRASRDVKKGRLFEGTALGSMADVETTLNELKKKQ